MTEDNTLPEQVFRDLLANAGNEQTRRKLRILHGVLAAHSEAGEVDFSIVTIGNLSAKAGGPAGQTMRNKPYGEGYKRLVKVWAEHSGIQPRPVRLDDGGPKLYNLLDRIDDPALRAALGSIIAERNMLKRENNTLKGQTEFVIDQRPAKAAMEVLAPMEGILEQMEIEALEDAVSDRFMDSMGWSSDETGRVKMGKAPVYKAGYMTGMKKILGHV